MARVHSVFAFVVASGLIGAGACKKDEKKSDPAAKTTDQKGTTAEKGGDKPAVSPGGASDDLSLLPVDSEAVMGLNVSQLQSSSLWKQFVEPQMMKGEFASKLAEFKAKCGFDPIASIKNMSFGLKGVGTEKPDGVIVVRGPDKTKTLACFDKMKDEAAKSGDEVTRDGDVVTIKPKDAEPVALTFINDTTAVAVVGPQATKDGVMKAAQGGSTLKSSPAFVEMYGKINTSASLWMLINGNAKVFEQTAQMGVKPKAVFGSVNVTDGLAVDFRVRLDSADQATQMANAFKGQVAGFASMTDKLEITSDGPDVKLVVAMSQQKLENAVKNLGALIGGGMGGGGRP